MSRTPTLEELRDETFGNMGLFMNVNDAQSASECLLHALRAAEQCGKDARIMTSEVWALIQTAEQRGIERAASEIGKLNMSLIPPKSDYDTASIAAFSYAELRIRALAQGGENNG